MHHNYLVHMSNRIQLLLATQHYNRIYNVRSTAQLEELDDPAVSELRRVIAEVKQHWSVIGWVTENLLSSSSVLRKAR
jgi:hypothetical protein